MRINKPLPMEKTYSENKSINKGTIEEKSAKRNKPKQVE